MKKIFLLLALVGFLNSKAQNININPTQDFFSVQMGFSASDPADATEYVFGPVIQQNIPATIATRRLMKFPFNATCIGVSIIAINAGVLGSAETSTVYLTVNGSDNIVSTEVAFTAISQNYSTANLNIPITAGTTFEGQYLTPTWATNPTVSSLCVIYYFRKD